MFVYFVSAASLESTHCNREVDYALDKELEILPVYLDKTELTPELKLALNRVQALHRTTDRNYQQHLLDALGRLPVVHQVSSTGPKKTSWLAYASMGLLLAVVAGGWWYQQRDSSLDVVVDQASVEEDSPVSGQQSRVVAVMGFRDLSSTQACVAGRRFERTASPADRCVESIRCTTWRHGPQSIHRRTGGKRRDSC
jgi:hypothetical protein